MIYLFGGQKGGPGKSTGAINLATYLANKGRDVLLVDADDQPSASKWVYRRTQTEAEPSIHCVQKSEDISEAIMDLSNRYEDIVIDAAGRNSSELRSGLIVANKMIMPVKPSMFNLETIPKVIELCKQALLFNKKLSCMFYYNEVSTHPRMNERNECKELLQEVKNIEIFTELNAQLYQRSAYRKCEKQGLSVIESSDPKAINDFEKLASEIISL